METQGQPSTSGAEGGSGQQDEIDVTKLSEDKIRTLMRRDPKFIGRLITMLDSQFDRMMQEKKKRSEQIEADDAAIKQLDNQISQHITPHLARLTDDLKTKTALRDHLRQQLDVEVGNFMSLERNAAAIVSQARHAAGRLYRTTATNTLLETKGFTASIPTTTILKSTKKSAKGLAVLQSTSGK